MAHIRVPEQVRKLLASHDRVIKIDLGCGKVKEEGFIGIDKIRHENVDIVFDLESSSWPLPDGCATLVMARNIVEYIEPRKFIQFMNEIWRILKIDGQLLILTPYSGNTAWHSDPLIVNGCTARTWDFFNPESPYFERYSPKPWKVENCFFRPEGNMEVLLIKRAQYDRSK